MNKIKFRSLTVGILSIGILGSSFVFGGANEAEAASTNYIRGYSCNGKTVATGDKNKSEAEAYNWIIKYYNKGYVQAGQSGGTTLGVVLNDTKIDFSSSSYNAVSLGSTGSYVKAVQTTLECIGYDVGAIDGIFGKQTQSAVKAFQTKKGLTPDGVVGRQTYHYLSFSN
ncbi:peptidoglycan-binding domain-containing protein [Metabacillus niabensis]|uniref:peptidoglycan-binding domain-containing protein n=1 Tax=Metabacillus niabensis TaxID=324854 RepID=UPI00399FDB63